MEAWTDLVRAGNWDGSIACVVSGIDDFEEGGALQPQTPSLLLLVSADTRSFAVCCGFHLQFFPFRSPNFGAHVIDPACPEQKRVRRGEVSAGTVETSS